MEWRQFTRRMSWVSSSRVSRSTRLASFSTIVSRDGKSPPRIPPPACFHSGSKYSIYAITNENTTATPARNNHFNDHPSLLYCTNKKGRLCLRKGSCCRFYSSVSIVPCFVYILAFPLIFIAEV